MRKLMIYPSILLLSIVLHFQIINLGLVSITFAPSVVFFVIVFIMIVLEKIFPYKVEWNNDLGDFKADFIQTLIVLPIVAKIIEVTYRYLHFKFSITSPIASWPFWIQFIVITLAAEFLFYWYHRISHTNKFLLKFHAVHHGALRVYWANSGRFHFVDLFFQFSLYFIPVYLLSGDEMIASLFLTLNAITGTLEHTNIDFKTIFISRIFNTAELHRLHHSKKVAECNTNYGKILSVWDTVFGSYYKPKFKRENFTAGLPGGRPVPNDFWGQIMYPFKSKKG